MGEPPCECDGPGWCGRYSIEQQAYPFEVCRGLHGEHKGERYRKKWRLALATGGPGPRPLAPGAATPQPAGGPGTELKKLLAALGLKAGDCACESRALRMDREGAAWCRANRAEIVAWLDAERKRRGWWEAAKAAARAVAGDFMPNPLDPLGSLLDEAIRRAEAT